MTGFWGEARGASARGGPGYRGCCLPVRADGLSGLSHILVLSPGAGLARTRDKPFGCSLLKAEGCFPWYEDLLQQGLLLQNT